MQGLKLQLYEILKCFQNPYLTGSLKYGALEAVAHLPLDLFEKLMAHLQHSTNLEVNGESRKQNLQSTVDVSNALAMREIQL